MDDTLFYDNLSDLWLKTIKNYYILTHFSVHDLISLLYILTYNTISNHMKPSIDIHQHTQYLKAIVIGHIFGLLNHASHTHSHVCTCAQCILQKYNCSYILLITSIVVRLFHVTQVFSFDWTRLYSNIRELTLKRHW